MFMKSEILQKQLKEMINDTILTFTINITRMVHKCEIAKQNSNLGVA